MAFSVVQIQGRNKDLLLEGARNIALTIIATRQWNASVGGVYVQVSKDVPPNPYLAQHPVRDLTSTHGIQLTLVNPAYMTRLIAEVVGRETPLSVRMTSLKPLNPKNSPDEWDAQALLALENGAREISGLSETADGRTEFRYAAPLKVDASCLSCHAQQGYQIGDVRGSISIGQPYATFAASAQREIIHSALRHLLVFALLAGLSHLLLRALLKHLKETELALATLVQSEKMASVGRLVSGFAHELNTPLGVAVNAISHSENCAGALSRLVEQDEVSEHELSAQLDDMRQAFKLALSNLRRASSLIQGFKRSSISMEQEDVQRFNLGELIEDLTRNLLSLYKNCAEIELICPAHTEITSTPGLLDQILTTLIMNSVSHGFVDGTRQGHIRIEVDALQNNQLLISYADDGVGMSPETLAHAFEPFFTTKRDSGGSGLGLYICYDLVSTRLHGSIRCDSLPEGGTHFLITLPVSLNNPTGQ